MNASPWLVRTSVLTTGGLEGLVVLVKPEEKSRLGRFVVFSLLLVTQSNDIHSPLLTIWLVQTESVAFIEQSRKLMPSRLKLVGSCLEGTKKKVPSVWSSQETEAFRKVHSQTRVVVDQLVTCFRETPAYLLYLHHFHTAPPVSSSAPS